MIGDGLSIHAEAKPDGEARWITRLGNVDANRYRQLVTTTNGALAVHVSQLPHGATVAMARARWSADVTDMVSAERRPTVLVSDVRACYQSIRPVTVAIGLVAAGVDPRDAERIARFLRHVERRGVRGLPVGPRSSAILAEVVLAPCDRAARDAGARIARWVDDVVIVASGRRRAARAFDAWAAALGAVGLRPHEGKTRLVVGREEGMRLALGSGASFNTASARGMMPAP
jgi:hypothetical protein